MAKGSGTTKASSSRSPKGLSNTGGGLVNEAKKLGISATGGIQAFEKAQGYIDAGTSSVSYQQWKEVSFDASQTIMNINNAESEKARDIMRAEKSRAMRSGDEAAYDKAQEKYEARMAKVRAYTDKLNRIMNQFNERVRVK